MRNTKFDEIEAICEKAKLACTITSDICDNTEILGIAVQEARIAYNKALHTYLTLLMEMVTLKI